MNQYVDIVTTPYYDFYEADEMLGLGVISYAVSIPLLIIGPINIAKSGKYRRLANEAVQGNSSMRLEPIFSPKVGTHSKNIGMQAGFRLRF